MPDPITNMLQEDTERLKKAERHFQNLFNRLNRQFPGYSPQPGDPLYEVFERQRATVHKAMEEINRIEKELRAAGKEVYLTGPGAPSVQAQRIVRAGPEAWARAIEEHFGG